MNKNQLITENMKKIIISFISGIVLASVLLSISIFAALPPTVDPQYENASDAKCQIFIGSNFTTALASIEGKSRSSVNATVTLYKTKFGTTSVIYTDSATNDVFSKVSFEYNFSPEIGATYRLELYGVVTLNGVDEIIQESDTMVFRDISLQ